MSDDRSSAAGVASSKEADRRSLLILILAAVVGIGLGSLTALGWLAKNHLPGSVVVRVNETDIQLTEYQRALELFASERRDPLRDHDRNLVLQRMVEEELLVQYGVDSGLVRVDRGVRTAAIESILAGLLVETEADSAGTAHDARLREYLGQLRETATIRWQDGEPVP